MKKYEAYKDSGVEWLGKVPLSWNLVKLKYILETKSGSSVNAELISDDFHIPVIGGNGILGKTQDYNSKGRDIIIGRVGAHCGNVHLLDGKKWVTDNALLIKTNINERYLTYVLKFLKLNRLANTNAQPLITGTIIKDQFIALPNEREYLIQIAKYLDHKTEIIDELIEKKEQLIQKLQAQRQAIINEAVTKGLNPNAKMKDSGVEWLGEIPEHWEVIKLRYLADITTGGKDTENREDDGEYPFFVRSQTIERISTYSFDGEAILTAGDGVGVCKVWHYINDKFDFHQRVYMMYNFKQVTGKFLFQFLKENFVHEVLKLSAKSTVDSLRRPMFLNFPVAVPPLKEQNKIVEIISNSYILIDKSIVKIITQINKLKSYRQSLISEAVTGKIDVRDWQAPDKN